MKNIKFLLLLALVCFYSNGSYAQIDEPKSISGIYPSLAVYNNEGECGIGAVVPWADRLWVITYGPHLPNGSTDKLYEITPDLQQIVRDESVGGTPANRMIHKESNQLFIGPYAIAADRTVCAISPKKNGMPGRHTANARHLTDPANKIYYATMEEGFYEVDVNTLAVTTLYPDNQNGKVSGGANLNGAHGKGAYSGQGVLCFANNGEKRYGSFNSTSGVLAEWDGSAWKEIRRNQFTEITGPGGIYGNTHPETDPLWTIGWDYKSLLLGVRDPENGWTFFRLPKASHSYDGAHGWNTEWPRIRNIGTDENPDYLMTMHGMFWRFPGTFTAKNSAGVRPRSAYLKVIGDFARWNDRLVFGCDDTAQKEFLNTRKAKGSAAGPGQSNSNLWFTSLTTPDALGIATVCGSVWEDEKETVKANMPSDPFLFAGWKYRNCWIKNNSSEAVVFTFEVDEKGIGEWKTLKQQVVDAGKSLCFSFSESEQGEWIRVKTDKDCDATVSFTYTEEETRTTTPNKIFTGLALSGNTGNSTGGLLRSLGGNCRKLGLLANTMGTDISSETGYYEMNDKLELVAVENSDTAAFMRTGQAIPIPASCDITIDESSVLIIDDSKRRWRLPISNEQLANATVQGRLRMCREIATERDLFSCMGTFYELPAENADGYAKIRPIASHKYCINDYASYRGMLVMSGVTPEEGENNPHIVISDDKKAAVWVGAIDDLWKLGKPVGVGGPLKDDNVKAGVASDPYLIGFYDTKKMSLSHKNNTDVIFTVEVDPTGNGSWMEYSTFNVKSGETVTYEFPEGFQARWIRFKTNVNAEGVTAWLEYGLSDDPSLGIKNTSVNGENLFSYWIQNKILYIKSGESGTARLLSTQGQVLLQQSFEAGVVNMPVSNFASGVYLLSVSGKETNRTVKIVIS